MKLFNHWRYYGLGPDDYKKSMVRSFRRNITSLRRVNMVVAVLAACFSIYPIIVEKDVFRAGVYFIAVIIALLLYVAVVFVFRRRRLEKKINKRLKLIYVLIVLFYLNVILSGIYVSVWQDPDMIAGTFLCIQICALFLFSIPALLHFCLTLGSTILFILASVWVKQPIYWSVDITNALFSGALALIFGWHIIMSRLSWVSAAGKMEDERDNYYKQSTIDELTRLKNRRDFMHTLKRFISSYRQSDKYLCIAILDIDFFKNYNDHYGHPEGDKCLRAIGKALKELQTKGIYAARVGGEEFALLWFEEDSSNAKNVGDCVTQAIRDLKIPHEFSEAAQYITVSIGIHIAQCGISHDMQDLYDKADKALYAAKGKGRNCTVISS